MPGREAGRERLDGPAELGQLTTLVVTLRTEGPPFDDVGIQQVPVADRADPRTHIGARADQPLGFEDAQGFAYDGAGHLEPLADLLGNEGTVRAEVTGNDHLAELLDELAVETAPPAGRPPSARPTQLGIGTAPGPGSGTLPGRRFRVGIAVEFARAGQAGIDGAGGGHHGVRKGTHASFVGAARPPLEVFGEKHTKG
ncbi:hypothetical protein M2436_005728 [Streptomyces sp. HB372]|nr:hypothetical protein [Streptomyces sp. HB372]